MNKQSLPTNGAHTFGTNLHGQPHTSGQVLICPLEVWRKVTKNMLAPQHPCLDKQLDWSAKCAQAGKHGGFPLPHTETFPGHAALCISDLAFTKTKRVYVLHGASHS